MSFNLHGICYHVTDVKIGCKNCANAFSHTLGHALADFLCLQVALLRTFNVLLLPMTPGFMCSLFSVPWCTELTQEKAVDNSLGHLRKQACDHAPKRAPCHPYPFTSTLSQAKIDDQFCPPLAHSFIPGCYAQLNTLGLICESVCVRGAFSSSSSVPLFSLPLFYASARSFDRS